MNDMVEGYTSGLNLEDAKYKEITDEMIADRAKGFLEAGCLEAVNSELMFLRTELSKYFDRKTMRLVDYDEVLKKHMAKAVQNNDPTMLGILIMNYLRPAAEHEAEIMAEESLCRS